MKRLLPLLLASLLLAISADNLSAQILWEPEDGVPIRGYYEPHPSLILPGLSPGETFVVWSDPRTGNRDFRGQIMDVSGNLLWEEDGRTLITAPGNQYSARGATLDDGWLLGWMDDRGDDFDPDQGALYFQRFDSDGTPLWDSSSGDPEDGKLVFPDNRIVDFYDFLLDGNGGLYVVTATDRSEYQYDVRLFRLQLADGEHDPAWPENGLLVGAAPEFGMYYRNSILSLLPDPSGGVNVVWENEEDAYIVRVDSSGTAVWDEPTIINTFSQCCSDGEGGVYVTGIHNYGDLERSLNFNRILPDGTAVGGRYGVVLVPPEQRIPQVRALIHSEGDSVLLAARMNRTNNHWLRIFKLRLDDELELLWDHYTSIPQTHTFDIELSASDGQGGMALIVESRGDLSFHHVSSEGQLSPAGIDLPFYEYDGFYFSTIADHVVLSGLMQQYPESTVNVNLFNVAQQQLVFPLPGVSVASGMRGYVDDLDDPTLIKHQNKVIYSWLDERHRNDCRVPYFQVLDFDSGEPWHDITGLPCLDHYTLDSLGYSAFRNHLAPCPDGGFYTANSFFVEDDYDRNMILQKLNPDGTTPWSTIGLLFEGTEGHDCHLDVLSLLPDESGGVVALFTYDDWDIDLSTVGMAHLNSLGEILWQQGEHDFILVDMNMNQPWPVGFFMLEQGDRYVVVLNTNDGIRVVGVDEIGATRWTSSLNAAPSDWYSVTSEQVGNQVVVIWCADDYNLYGQLIDAHGNPQWGDDPLLLIPNANQNNPELYCRAAGPDSSSFWIAFAPLGLAGYAQRFNTADGSPAFATPLELEADHLRLVGQPDGGAYLMRQPVYADFANVVAVAADGSMSNQSVTVDYVLDVLDLIRDEEGGAIALWTDRELRVPTRLPSYPQTQRFYFTPASVTETQTHQPESFALAPVFPNPFNASATVSVTLPAPGDLNVSLFNVLGQEVMILAHGPHAPGTHTLTVDGSTLASGIYFVHAEIVDGTQAAGKPSVATRKLVMLK